MNDYKDIERRLNVINQQWLTDQTNRHRTDILNHDTEITLLWCMVTGCLILTIVNTITLAKIAQEYHAK